MIDIFPHLDKYFFIHLGVFIWLFGQFIVHLCIKFTIKNNKEMTTEKKHELARLVMEVIAPNQNLDLEEFVLSFRMLKTEQKLCDFVLELFNDDDDEKLRCIQKIKSFVNKNNGRVSMSDLQLESDISFKVIGNLHATICELSDVVFINLDKSSYDEYDNFEQVGTWVNYGDLPLDTLKELWEVLEK